MQQTITATYEHGVFVPRVPVNLPEHTEVKLLLPKIKTKRDQLTKAEMGFLALRGISHDLAGTDSVEMQKKIRSEWRALWPYASASLKKANQLAIADAIIVSTAIENRCSYLITFDTDFMRVGEIPVLTPQKFLELQIWVRN